MITVKNVKKPDGTLADRVIHSEEDRTIDGSGLLMLPALIDPHVHFRTPGAEHKENWMTAARAAMRGGITTVIDMPNNTPSCTTMEALRNKRQLIQEQLTASGIPLRYHLYFGADKKHLKEIPKAKGFAAGIKVFMGSSTGDLLIDDDRILEEVFRMAADLDMLVSVHAEDEEIIRQNKGLFERDTDPAVHSKIRNRDAAIKATSKALSLSDRFRTRLCVLHVSTKEEVELIAAAKAADVPVYGEVAPHHLLLSIDDYATWGSCVLVNPPLRTVEDQTALWEGINQGTIDFIGTDHAPHTLQEKSQPYGKAPSGIPSIDLLLPLLLTAVSQRKMSLETMIRATTTNIEHAFRLAPNNDVVLVDLNLEREATDSELATKCGWTPYAGRLLKGWPVYTIVQDKVFNRSLHTYA